MKSKKSAVEEQMKEMTLLCNDIIDDSYLTTKDARKLVDLLEKGLLKIEELRISRDNNATRCQELRKERDSRVSDKKLRTLMTKAFRKGQEKHEADINDSPVKLWIAGVIDDHAAVNKKK